MAISEDPAADDGWYFNVATGEVERLGHGRGMDLLGPYPDEATARRALEISHERTRQADVEDAEWTDPPD